MKKIYSFSRLLIISLIIANLSSCDNLVDYSPYDTDVKSLNKNAENISRIQKTPRLSDSLVIVVISDTHSNHTQLLDAISLINKMPDISFVVVDGDITNWALAKEYKDYSRNLSKLNVPSLTVIGNHDYLSNGAKIYRRMFGDTNFSFNLTDHKIVVFDNIVWERGNRSPDFDWLESALLSENDLPSILFTHIHPWDPQLENGYAVRLREIIENSPVLISVFGHGTHKYERRNNRQYLVVPKIMLRTLTRISLTPDTAVFKMIKF